MSERTIKRLANKLLQRFDMVAIEKPALRAIHQRANEAEKIALISDLSGEQLETAVTCLADSQSQIGQDLFALRETGWKRDGYFVDFGATDGKTLNNSWLLEKRFGWTGILAEPARVWRERLGASGRSASIEYDCVWDRTGEDLTFYETEFAELSTTEGLLDNDYHDRGRNNSYSVTTISLNDLLAKYDAPPEIDFLSIDTEGSEHRILKSLDFDRYRIHCIACEHNFTADREAIHALLTGKGYQRVYDEHSRWDDWYVLKS